MKNNMLVTGSTGFIGSHLVPLLSRSFHVTQFVRQKKKKSDVVGDLIHKPTDVITKSLAGINQVIHLASLTAKSKEDNTTDKARLFYMVNVIGTRNLLESLANTKLTHMIYVSTLDVYGDTFGKPITEETRTNPATYYGVSKLAAENACRAWCGKRNVPLAIARLGIVYGPGEDAYKKVIPVFIQQGLRGKLLEIYGTGKDLRDLIYVGDVARALMLLAKQKEAGVFNIASGTSYTVLDIAKRIHKLTGRYRSEGGDTFPPRGWNRFTPADGRKQDIVFDTTKFRSIGFRPKVSLDTGLAKEIAWFWKKLS